MRNLITKRGHSDRQHNFQSPDLKTQLSLLCRQVLILEPAGQVLQVSVVVYVEVAAQVSAPRVDIYSGQATGGGTSS